MTARCPALARVSSRLHRRWGIGLALAAVPALAGSNSAAAATLNQLTYLQVVSNVSLAQQLGAARKLGVRGVRLSVRWSEVERARGRFNWLPADGRIRAVQREGLTPLIVLFGGNALYPPPAGLVGSSPASESAFAGFARFAAEAAKRYGTGTAQAPIVYEIWNEPNTRTFWGRPPEPEHYAEMARRACEAIKRETPAAKVLALGMEGTPVKPPYVVKAYNLDIYQEWARRAATPGLMACADGISMHPYLSTPEQHHRLEPALQAYIAAHWTKATPPIVAHTEWGYAINPARGRTAQDQAVLDLRALLIGTATGRITNLYQAVDTGKDDAKPDGTFGFVTYFGALKPNGIALKRLLEAIGDFEIDGLDALPSRVYRYRAHHAGGTRAQVLWAPDATVPVPLAPGGTAIDLVTGVPRPIHNDSLEADRSPVLVTWKR